ncbi:MAG: lipopolysaccharide kinase InaA family protein [Kiritimatiellae bacterium]|nr:lipopolysaccharide kinase InaA family protein [Kiritimatiellia bacterium]
MVPHEDLRWQVAEASAAEFRRWLEAHWAVAMADSARLLKLDAASRVAAAGGMVVKKIRRPAGLRGWLTGLRRSRYRHAFEISRALRAAGVPVPEPMAWAVCRRRGAIVREYYVMREVASAESLMSLMERHDAAPPRQRRGVLEGLGELLGGLHRAGFRQRDFKDTNILVSARNDRWHLTAVDCDGIRRVRRVGAGLRRRDFFPLMQALALYGWDTVEDRQALWNGYAKAVGCGGEAPVLPTVTAADGGAPAGWRAVRRTIRLSGWRRRELQLYVPEDLPTWVNLGHRYWQGRLFALQPVPSSPHATVQTGAVDDTGKHYYFKRFHARSLTDAIKGAFRSSRACRAWRGSALASGLGFETPRTVCVMEVRAGCRLIGSAMVTEAVTGARSLDHALRGGPDGPPLAGAPRRELIAALGREIGRLHAAGLVHGDLRHGNVLCGEGQDRARFVLLDNERTRRCRRRHERARNLVQMNMIGPEGATLRERILFWRAYARATPGDGRYRRRLRAEVVSWTRRRWRERGWL